MARRGKEQQLQQELETQEEWEDMLSKEGLCVVDIYQDWSGPTKALHSALKKLKIDIGSDPFLCYFVAKADTIDALEKYRGRCEPCFLFFGGGVLVAVVRGANAPLILRTITEQLAQEHKVLDGQAERKEIKDTVIAQLEQKEKAMADEEEREKEEEGGAAHRLRYHGEIIDFGDDLSPYAEAKKEVSVVIIKPDAVQSGKAEEIMGEMTSRGIEILRQEERHLTEDEVRTLYSHLQDEEYFEDLVKFMSSNPCIVMVITKGKTGENIIKEFRDLIGPPGVDEAKEQAPESLRAKYGSDTVQNAVHAADSHETAVRELAFFFPDFVAPTVEGKPKLQRTLALIRPDVYKIHKDEIIAKIRESGFKVAMKKEVHLNKEQAGEFYSEHKDQDYFDELTTRMSSGPLLALGLAREDAIEGWRQMLGPTVVEEAKEQAPESLRAQFAVEGAPINMLHGSSTEEQAKKELEYFFPMEQTVAVIKPDAYQTKDEIIDKIHDAGFRIAARKETTLSRDIAEEFYSEHKDKEYYEDLVEHMTSGKTYFMVLSREGAVDGWRSLIGETDPNKAREDDPDSIRGQFGTDTLKNAVHGSSDVEHATSTIQKIFGELYFNKDGTAQDRLEGEQEPQKEEPKTEGDQQEPKTEQVEGEKQPEPEAKQTEQEPEKQAQPEPEAEPQQQQESTEEKAKSPEPQQETTEEKKEEPEPQQESTGEGEAQQQETKEEEPKQVETTKEEPAQQQEETQEKEEPAQQKEEETQEKQPEPEPEQKTEEKSEEKTETTEQSGETSEQKTEEQTAEGTTEEKKEETTEEKKEETTEEKKEETTEEKKEETT